MQIHRVFDDLNKLTALQKDGPFQVIHVTFQIELTFSKLTTKSATSFDSTFALLNKFKCKLAFLLRLSLLLITDNVTVKEYVQV